MNPNRIVRACLGVAAIVASLSSCTSSDEDGGNAGQGGQGGETNWDQLVWDQDDWS